MLRCEGLESVLVVAPHADDEALGCGGLLARLAGRGTRVHVVYAAVDGFHHYGLRGQTTYEQRLAEVKDVVEWFGAGCAGEVLFGG